MSFFSRILGRSTPPPTPRLDPTLNYVPARQAAAHARRGDWRSLRDVLEAETDPTARAHCITLAADVDGSEKTYAEWTSAEPKNPDAWLVSARRWMTRGSKIRGAARAQDVAEERWDPFHECVRRMEEDVLLAIELRGTDPLPWAYRLSAAMIFGDPLDVRIGLYEEGKKYAGTYGGFYSTAVYACTQKWGGAHDLMFRVAREALKAAPPQGSTMGLPIALAHVERWLHYLAFEKNANAAGAYFGTAAVQQELRRAAATSEGLTDPAATIAANMFGFCFWKMRDKAAAKEMLQRANGVLDHGFPFCYGGSEAYQEALDFAWS